MNYIIHSAMLFTRKQTILYDPNDLCCSLLEAITVAWNEILVPRKLTLSWKIVPCDKALRASQKCYFSWINVLFNTHDAFCSLQSLEWRRWQCTIFITNFSLYLPFFFFSPSLCVSQSPSLNVLISYFLTLSSSLSLSVFPLCVSYSPQLMWIT